jgi:putative ABC transport system permease protein
VNFRRRSRYTGLWLPSVMTAVGVVVFALGYSLTTSVAKRQSGIHNDQMVVQVGRVSSASSQPRSLLSPVELQELSASDVFVSIAAAVRIPVPASTSRMTQFVDVEGVAPGYFEALGVRALRGRTLSLEDFHHAAPSAALISEHLARTLFGSPDSAVGETIRLASAHATVVGLVGPDFPGVGTHLRPTRVWVPGHVLRSMRPSLLASVFDIESGERPTFNVLGRLPPDSSRTLAESALNRSLPGSVSGGPGIGVAERSFRWTVAEPNKMELRFVRSGALAVTLALALFLAACLASASNLLLARSLAQIDDCRIHIALGATVGKLVMREVTRNGYPVVVVLVVSAAVVASAQQLVRIDVQVAQAISLPIVPSFTVWTSALIGVGTLFVFFGILALPAFYAARTANQLPRHHLGLTNPRGRQKALVAFQVGATVALLVIARILGGTDRLGDLSPSLEIEHLGMITLSGLRDASPAGLIEAANSAAAVEALESVGIVAGQLFGSSTPMGRMAATMDQLGTVERPVAVGMPVFQADSGLLATLRLPVLFGRGIEPADLLDARDVVVLSRLVALDLFGTANAVGRRVLIRKNLSDQEVSDSVVVGVVADIDAPFAQRLARGLAVVPIFAMGGKEPTLVFRAREPARVVRAVEAAITKFDSTSQPFGTANGWALAGGGYQLGLLLGQGARWAGALTLFVAAAGVFSLVVVVAGLRIDEWSIRAALGAAPYQLWILVAWQGLRPAILGLVLGAGVGAAFVGTVRAVLFNVAFDANIADVVLVAFVVASVATAGAAAAAWRFSRPQLSSGFRGN